MKYGVMAVAAVVSIAFCAAGTRAEEASVKLPEVVVTATKTDKDPKDVTQSVTVITAEEIRKSGATTAAEAVRGAVALTVQEYGPRGAVNQISLRGSESDHVLILLDGTRLNSARSGGFNLSDLPVALGDIERIEIVRGASSALYGTDAIGGVVNIITKKPEKTVTNVQATAGSHGYDSLAIGTRGRSEQAWYRLSAHRDTSDGYRTNSDLDQYTIGGRIGYEITPDSSVELSADYLGKEQGVPGSRTWQTPFARQWTRNAITAASYRTDLSPDIDFSVRLNQNQERLTFQDAAPASEHKSITNGASGQFVWRMNTWNTLTAGAEGRTDTVHSTDAGDHAARLWAGYVQSELALGKALIIVLGARHDDHSVYGDTFTPRVSARYLVHGSDTIIRASAGKGFRAPTFNELYWTDAWGNVGNPDLKSETSKEYEGGIEQPFGDAVKVKATGFARKVKNLINWVEYASFQYTPENIGRAQIRGYEAEVSATPFKALTLAVNYTYVNPVDEQTGEKIQNVPETQLKGSANLTLPMKTSIWFEGRMTKNYPQPGVYEKYFVLDGKLMQPVRYSEAISGDFFIGMRNIFDRTYEVVKGYPMPPREILGGMSVQF